MGHKSVSEDLSMLMVCKEMSWTHNEYMEQPEWFVSSIREMLQADAKKSERDAKKKSPKK